MSDPQTPFNADFPQEWFPGWHLVGRYGSGVGCWLLVHGGEALLLEVPEGLMTTDVIKAARLVGGPRLTFVTASHEHEDHLDPGAWGRLKVQYPEARFILPRELTYPRKLSIGGEPLYLLRAPKHSPTDVVTVFRGVAMTGDLELGTLACCGDGEWNEEDLVPMAEREATFSRLREFPRRTGYRVHTVVSAHLDDVRRDLSGDDWEALFTAPSREGMRL